MAEVSIPPAPQAVLFDLDDTLTDRRASVARYVGPFLAEFGPRLDDAALPPRPEIEAWLQRADGAGYNPRRPQDLVEAFAWTDRPAAGEVDRHWLSHFPGCSVERSGLSECLAWLRERRVPTALVTNGPGPGQRAKLRHLAIERAFAHRAISEELGCEKPDPAIFATALEGVGCGAAAAWFVGDHPRKDIAAARAVGLHAIWVRASHPWPDDEAPPLYTVSDLHGLLRLLAAATR